VLARLGLVNLFAEDGQRYPHVGLERLQAPATNQDLGC
jgi:hypothetical protein